MSDGFFEPEDFRGPEMESGMVPHISSEGSRRVALIANRLLAERGQRVKGDGDLFCVGKVYDGIEPTHTALLIDVREIQRDTPELLLREYVKTRNSSCWTGTEFDSWLERVRKVLK